LETFDADNNKEHTKTSLPERAGLKHFLSLFFRIAFLLLGTFSVSSFRLFLFSFFTYVYYNYHTYIRW